MQPEPNYIILPLITGAHATHQDYLGSYARGGTSLGYGEYSPHKISVNERLLNPEGISQIMKNLRARLLDLNLPFAYHSLRYEYRQKSTEMEQILGSEIGINALREYIIQHEKLHLVNDIGYDPSELANQVLDRNYIDYLNDPVALDRLSAFRLKAWIAKGYDEAFAQLGALPLVSNETGESQSIMLLNLQFAFRLLALTEDKPQLTIVYDALTSGDALPLESLQSPAYFLAFLIIATGNPYIIDQIRAQEIELTELTELIATNLSSAIASPAEFWQEVTDNTFTTQIAGQLVKQLKDIEQLV